MTPRTFRPTDTTTETGFLVRTRNAGKLEWYADLDSNVSPPEAIWSPYPQDGVIFETTAQAVAAIENLGVGEVVRRRTPYGRVVASGAKKETRE